MFYNLADSIFIEMTSGIRFNNLTILGIYENKLTQDKIDNYIPIQDKYTIDISYKLGNFIFNLQHWCSHSLNNEMTGNAIINNSARRQFSVEYRKEF